MPEYMGAFLVAMILVLIFTPLVIFVAKRTGAFDKPDSRKVHTKLIPRIGGVGIYLAFMLVMGYFLLQGAFPREMQTGFLSLMFGGTCIVILGLIDDYYELSAKVKLLGQIACAAIVVAFEVRIDVITDPFGDFLYLEYFAIPVTIFWMVGITNTVNLIDGLDGLAAGVATIASLTLFLVAMEQGLLPVAIFTAVLAGASFGFLHYNFYPARIFMGDTGSMFLGFMLAGISALGALKSTATIALVAPILALGLPIFDTGFAIFRRYKSGMPIFKPDRGHLHHRLLDLGFSQKQAVLLMYVISAVLGLTAVSLANVNFWVGCLIFFLVIITIFLGAKRIGVLKIYKANEKH